MKKITALILAILIVISAMPSVYATESTEFFDSEFLRMLGIVDFEIPAPGETFTRAEFARMLVRAMNQEADVCADIFTDVTSSTPHCGFVAKAYNLGFVNGGASGVFMPEEPISADAALKMAVVALGYEDAAAAYGGYPVGYLRVANETDLTDGVEISDNFSAEDAMRLITNFLGTDVCKVVSVSDGTMNVVRDVGNTPLTLYFDLQKETGIARTAGHVSMARDYNGDRSEFYINGNTYTTEIEDAERYLGLEVSVWYDSQKRVKAVRVEEDNKIVTYFAKDIDRKEGNTIYIYNESNGKETKAVLDPSYSFVKNGRGINPVSEDFTCEGAELTLIDNNGDNKYDAVIAFVPEYMVVSYINPVEGLVFDAHGSGKQLVLDSESGVYYTLTGTDKDGSDVPVWMEDLAKDDVIKYYISHDGKYVKAEVSKTSVSGTIEEKYDNKIVINGTEYEVNPYFGDSSKLKFGVEYTILLASDNTVTAISSTKAGEMRYGFLIKYKKITEGLSDCVMLAVLEPDNQLFEAELADKITLDGKGGVEKDSAALGEMFLGDNAAKCQIIRYSVNFDGKIDKIDTALTLESSEFGYDKLLDSGAGDNDSLVRHLHKANVYYISDAKAFSPNTIIGSSTIFISVPTDFDETGAKVYDENDFSFITTAELGRYGPFTVTMYDVNKDYEPGVVMVYNGISGKNVTLTNESSPSVVKEVTKGINEEGDAVYMFSVYRGKSAYKLSLSIEKSREYESNPDGLPSTGDIIRYAVNSDGEIANFRIDVRYTPASDGAEAGLKRATGTGVLGQALSNYAIHFGKSYHHSDSAVALIVKSGMESSYNYYGGVAVFRASSPNVIIYDSVTQTVRSGSTDMLKDAVSVGEENASLIAIKCYDNRITDVIIYQ